MRDQKLHIASFKPNHFFPCLNVPNLRLNYSCLAYKLSTMLYLTSRTSSSPIRCLTHLSAVQKPSWAYLSLSRPRQRGLPLLCINLKISRYFFHRVTSNLRFYTGGQKILTKLAVNNVFALSAQTCKGGEMCKIIRKIMQAANLLFCIRRVYFTAADFLRIGMPHGWRGENLNHAPQQFKLIFHL